MPNVSLIGHYHRCPLNDPGPVPHVGGPIVTGQSICTVNGVAVVGDICRCQTGASDPIVSGAGNFTINGKTVALTGSRTAHGGVLVEGDAACRAV